MIAALRAQRLGAPVWLLALFVLSLAFVNPYLRGDGNGYYAWLRSSVIDRDVHFGNEYLRADPIFRAAFVDDAGNPTREMRTGTGLVENQWSAGPAVLWLPFFAAAHALALTGAGTPDGFSPVYLWSVAAGTAMYGFAAILLGADLARRFGQRKWAVPAAIAILLASPLPVYMYLLPFHVHALAAFAAGLFLWWGLVRIGGWHTSRWLVWGLTAGLMVAVYYVHAVLLALVAIKLLQRGTLSDRARAIGAFAAGAVPGLAVHFGSRYALYGSAFTTGYRDEFFWFSPRVLATAFSPEHGLFSWTPVLLLALAGLAMAARRDTRARALLVVWAILFYVIASYQNWHGISSFGNRFFVSLTVAFVAGVALALPRLAGVHRALPVLAITALAAWNAGFVFQWGLNIVPSRGPVSFAEVARNQVTVVPSRLGATALRYFTNRRSLTSDVESEDIREREGFRHGR